MSLRVGFGLGTISMFCRRFILEQLGGLSQANGEVGSLIDWLTFLRNAVVDVTVWSANPMAKISKLWPCMWIGWGKVLAASLPMLVQNISTTAPRVKLTKWAHLQPGSFELLQFSVQREGIASSNDCERTGAAGIANIFPLIVAPPLNP